MSSWATRSSSIGAMKSRPSRKSSRSAGMYESDLTRFMKRFLEEHPEEIESQKKGRAVWWDKTSETRSSSPSMRHAPRAGGAGHTFLPSGVSESVFRADDDSE